MIRQFSQRVTQRDRHRGIGSAVCQVAVGSYLALIVASAFAQGAQESSERIDGWEVFTSENFRVCARSPWNARVIAERCEHVRRALGKYWLAAEAATWSAPCHVVMHPTVESYLAEVGREGAQTLGSSLVAAEQGKPAYRRLDLRGDLRDALDEALPHEMTHLVLADLFKNSRLPRWVDEGAAVLADSTAKQLRHQADWHSTAHAAASISLHRLFAHDDLAFGRHRPAFYGQSASLVRYLVARKSPKDFLGFVLHAERHGYDSALAAFYGLADVAALEQSWRSSLESRSELEPVVRLDASPGWFAFISPPLYEGGEAESPE